MNEQSVHFGTFFRTITGGGAASLCLEVLPSMCLHTPFSTLSQNLRSPSSFPRCCTLATQVSWFSHSGFLRVLLAFLLPMPSFVRSMLLSRSTELLKDVQIYCLHFIYQWMFPGCFEILQVEAGGIKWRLCYKCEENRDHCVICW